MRKAVLFCFATIMMASSSSAQTICQKDWKWYYAKYLAKNSKHFAIATINGLPMADESVVCAFAGGQKTLKLAEQEALRVCRIGIKKYKQPGKCKVIKTR